MAKVTTDKDGRVVPLQSLSPVSSFLLDVKINYLEVSELDQLDPCHWPASPSPTLLGTYSKLGPSQTVPSTLQTVSSTQYPAVSCDVCF